MIQVFTVESVDQLVGLELHKANTALVYILLVPLVFHLLDLPQLLLAQPFRNINVKVA